MMQQFDVVLLFELGEQRIATGVHRRGGEQHRQTVVTLISLRGSGIESKLLVFYKNCQKPVNR
jgi:hypothetical protein